MGSPLWGHFCGDNQKKKIPFIIINYYYWSKFAEEWKNEKWIIVYKTNNPKKHKKKRKRKKSVRMSSLVDLSPTPNRTFAWQGWEHFTWQGCTINLLQTVAPKEPRDYETAQDRISNAASIWSLHRINALMPMHWFEQMVVFILFMCSQFHMHMCVSEFLPPPSPVQ